VIKFLHAHWQGAKGIAHQNCHYGTKEIMYWTFGNWSFISSSERKVPSVKLQFGHLVHGLATTDDFNFRLDQSARCSLGEIFEQSPTQLS
jgi:hypothetical protein